jgi:uncharacterized membrane protein YedE/YeeE
MTEELAPHLVRAGLAFATGLVLGSVARRSRFCTLGAIEDAVYARDTKRLRAWGLAIAVAVIGTHLLASLTVFDLSKTIYVSPRLEWAGAIVGGLMFGIGMALVGTCGFGTLLRLGGGDLKALLTFLVIAISSYMAMRGVTGLLRIHLVDPLALDLSPRTSQTIGSLLGLDASGNWLVVAIAALGLLALIFSDRTFRQSRRLITSGALIGMLVVAGWWITGVAGQDPFEVSRAESFTFVAPLGETLFYVMLASGVQVDFAVGAVVGVLGGAFAAARVAGEFRWEAPDDVREIKRHLLGAFLMGNGGVMALGCTVGQGITGVSTLSAGSIMALVSILVGARAGLYWLVER